MLAGRRFPLRASLCAGLIGASTPSALGSFGPPGSSPAPAVASDVLGAPADGREQRAPLTLVLNGVENDVVIAILRAGDALVSERDLRVAGVPIAGATFVEVGTVRYVSIASLAPSVTYTVDVPNLVLRLTADPRLLPRTVAGFGPDGKVRKLATADPSGFLNYSLTSAASGANRRLQGFLQTGIGDGKRLFMASGSFSAGATRRGLVSLQRESQEHLSRATIGDEVASTGPLGGSAVVGGIGFTRHFEFQPDYVFFPTPGVSGTVLTPTKADVYVNGAFVRSVQLPPGQFDLTNLPLPAGLNITQVVLHDAAGNDRTISAHVYQARQLLRKGVTDYDYHVGFLRSNPFGDHDTYGPLAGLAAYRLGLTDSVTVGARYEQSKRLVSGGPQIDLGLPVGHLSLEASLSSADGVGGHAYGAAYDMQGRRFAFGLSAQATSAQYATMSLDVTRPRTRSATQQSVSFPLGKSVSLGASHTTSTFTGQPTADRLSATVNTRLSRGLGLTFNADRDRGGSVLGFGVVPGNRLSAGLTAAYTLGRSTNVFLHATDNGGAGAADVTVSKSAPNGPGFGYIVRASGAGQSSASANLTYQTQYADLSLLTNSGSGSSSSTLTLAGSVVAFAQGVFLTRPISNSYTLAEVPGFDHLPVYLGTQYQGRTDRRGAMIVPVLSAYADNEIGIDEMKDRFDVVAEQPNRSVRPRIYSGVVAKFGVRVLRAYNGTVVVRRNGRDVVPAFARLSLTNQHRTYVSDLGSDGQFYLDDITPDTYSAQLAGAGLSCDLSVTIPAAEGPITKLPVLVCDAAP